MLYGKYDLLERMQPYQGGGDMIQSVSFERTEFQTPPYRFEAGTPHIAGAIGLAAAVDYVSALGPERIAAHEAELLAYGTEKLAAIEGVRLYGTAGEKAGVLSFTINGVHPHDAGTILDREGVAVRAGHHCAQPVMEFYGVPATIRASFGCYNTIEDIDRLAGAIMTAKDLFGA